MEQMKKIVVLALALALLGGCGKMVEHPASVDSPAPSSAETAPAPSSEEKRVEEQGFADSVTHTASQLYALKDAPLKSLVEDLACYDVWAMTPLSENVSVTANEDELTVTVAEPPPTLDWDDLTVLARNNSTLLLALREELTKVEWQIQRDDRTLQVTLAREDESRLLQELEGSKSSLAAYGETREGIQELIGLLESGSFWFEPVMTEPFYDVLGYDGYIETKRMISWDWTGSTYYAETETGTFPIGECFGFGGGEAYRVDLDGDGQEELVCNVIFGGDGAHRVAVYQRRADGIYWGTLDPHGLPDYSGGGEVSWWAEYDPEENVFRLHYTVDHGSGDAVLETHGLERMEFQPYGGGAA